MRKSTIVLFHAFAILGFILGATMTRAQDAPQVTQLPIVRGPPAQVSSVPILLDAGDNSYIDSVASSSGQCVFLAFIDRDGGNRLLVKQDAGDHLIDVPLPPTASRALQGLARDRPGFAAPGDKQADGSLSVRNGVLSLHYTSRAVGDPDGAFHLWRLDIAEPACQL